MWGKVQTCNTTAPRVGVHVTVAVFFPLAFQHNAGRNTHASPAWLKAEKTHTCHLQVWGALHWLILILVLITLLLHSSLVFEADLKDIGREKTGPLAASSDPEHDSKWKRSDYGPPRPQTERSSVGRTAESREACRPG